MNSFGWLRSSGFARHKDPMLDAAGALADLLVFSLNLTGLDILQKIENQDNSWSVVCTINMTCSCPESPNVHPAHTAWQDACDLCRWAYRLLFKDLWHADKKQDRNALAKPLLNILQQVEGNPVVKSKVLHLFRSAADLLDC